MNGSSNISVVSGIVTGSFSSFPAITSSGGTNRNNITATYIHVSTDDESNDSIFLHLWHCG